MMAHLELPVGNIQIVRFAHLRGVIAILAAVNFYSQLVLMMCVFMMTSNDLCNILHTIHRAQWINT